MYVSVELMLEELKIDPSLFSDAGAESQDGSAASPFSQVVVLVPPETGVLCLRLLWALKERGIVLDWHWEDGVLLVWVDTELLLRRTSVPEGVANSWLLRLIEVTQSVDCHPYQNPDDQGTDFSYLCYDSNQTRMQSA